MTPNRSVWNHDRGSDNQRGGGHPACRSAVASSPAASASNVLVLEHEETPVRATGCRPSTAGRMPAAPGQFTEGHVPRTFLSRLAPFLLVLLFALAAPVCAQQPAGQEPRVRFRAVDVFIDSTNAPLAAYQLEFAVTNGVAKIVGIEGGEHSAFHEAPFYDPRAVQRERVIIAAFSTNAVSELPTGRTRVATIHLQINGDSGPAFEFKLSAAAGPNGDRLAAGVSAEERKPQ